MEKLDLYSNEYIENNGLKHKWICHLIEFLCMGGMVFIVVLMLTKYGDVNGRDLPSYFPLSLGILGCILFGCSAIDNSCESAKSLKEKQTKQLEIYNKEKFQNNYKYSVYFEDKSDGTNKVILCNSFTSYSDGSVTIHSESKDFVYKNSERIYYHHINDNSYGKTLTAEEISKFHTGRKTETNNKGTD